MAGQAIVKKNKTKEEEEEDEIIRELCVCNGIVYEQLEKDGPTTTMLEMFFSGMSSIAGMQYFPNLQFLTIMGQAVTAVTGLSHCPLIKELWICECQLKKIDGLKYLTKLEKLYLYSNNIPKIENIEHLTKLHTLWLNDNKISDIEGLVTLKQLKELNLAENKIDKLGNSLTCLQSLERLELSGNQLDSFKDLTNLVKLPNLVELGLKNSLYKTNPAGMLCNYSTHLLYHMPRLAILDTYDVTSRTLRDMVETTVMKKKMYYSMKMKTIRRNLADMQNRLINDCERLLTAPHERIRKLAFAVKEIERETKEMKDFEDEVEKHESGTESDKDAREAKVAQGRFTLHALRNKQKTLTDRMDIWKRKCEEILFWYKDCEEKVKQKTDVTIQRLSIELETGGNIRYEYGSPTDIWYSACHDLLLSRFCAADYRDYGIIGIKIHRITRIHNRVLRTKFDERLSHLIEEEEQAYATHGNTSITTNANANVNHTPGQTALAAPAFTAPVCPTTKNVSYKKLLEYLFWIWDPELPGAQHERDRVLQQGFMDAMTCKELGKDAVVPLTNSLHMADKPRIGHSLRLNRSNTYHDMCPFRHGQMILSKVYLGKNCQNVKNRPVDAVSYPGMNSIYRPKHLSGYVTDAVLSLEPCSTVPGSISRCECSSRQCEWFIFDHKLAMPEYLVDFEYITRIKPMSPFATYAEGSTAFHPEFSSTVNPENVSTDDDVLDAEPKVKPRPRLIDLSEELLMKTCDVKSLQNIQVLNLHGNGLKKLKCVQLMPTLKKLVVSFNELTRLDDIAQTCIEELDVSFNRLTTMDGLKGMSKLKWLDVSWNQLQNTREDISILRKHAPTLEVLDLRHNKWQKPDGLRLRVIGRIKSLTRLNNELVTEAEATAALRMAAGSRVSQVSLLAQSRTDLHPTANLSLLPNAQFLMANSRNKPDRTGEQDSLWYTKVTTLVLDGQHISKLSNLERLENLRWASFNDNDITKIEGLEQCHRLEELSLEHNCITKLEGVSCLRNLRKLCLGHNYISSLEFGGLEHLHHLHYLSVESNKISTLAGLQRDRGLVEIYLANNTIENLREVFYLKTLPNLVILDLFGNPLVTQADNYRLFVIYHLKSLKALDGTTIEIAEGNMAKDTFGGRLTPDFIAERLGHADFQEIRELDLPQASIRTVDLGNCESFVNLRSVNLEHNNLTSFSGLIHLVNLRVLCLNHNHVESIVSKPRGTSQFPARIRPSGMSLPEDTDPYNPENYTPLLENLEVLHLGYNGIKDLISLQLNRLIGLKALFLQGNDIGKIEGLETLQDLRELVLDRNRIKSIDGHSLASQWNLQELHIEENRVKDLGGIGHMENLQRLYLGMNRIQDMGELEKLETLPSLVELSVVGNPIARRLMHRPMLVYRIPGLVIIDGIPVSDEERTKAELYFIEQQEATQQKQMPVLTATMETTLPGIGQYKSQIPVKVTNMQLLSGPFTDRNLGAMFHLNDEIIQQELQRGGGRKRGPVAGTQVMGGGRSDVGVSLQQNAQAKLSGTLSYQHASNNSQQLSQQQQQSSRSQNTLVSQVPYVPSQQQSAYDYINQYEGYSRTTRSNKR